jgi:hypothetical protein
MSTGAARFVHVGFRFNGPEPIEQLEKTFGSALNWLRYDTHCWIIHTTTDLDTWRDRIRNTPGVLEEDMFFLAEFTAHSGYMDQTSWDWIKKFEKGG